MNITSCCLFTLGVDVKDCTPMIYCDTFYAFHFPNAETLDSARMYALFSDENMVDVLKQSHPLLSDIGDLSRIVDSMRMRIRYAGSNFNHVYLVKNSSHLIGDESFTRDSIEAYISNLTKEELQSFLNSAKM